MPIITVLRAANDFLRARTLRTEYCHESLSNKNPIHENVSEHISRRFRPRHTLNNGQPTKPEIKISRTSGGGAIPRLDNRTESLILAQDERWRRA